MLLVFLFCFLTFLFVYFDILSVLLSTYKFCVFLLSFSCRSLLLRHFFSFLYISWMVFNFFGFIVLLLGFVTYLVDSPIIFCMENGACCLYPNVQSVLSDSSLREEFDLLRDTIPNTSAPVFGSLQFFDCFFSFEGLSVGSPLSIPLYSYDSSVDAYVSTSHLEGILGNITGQSAIPMATKEVYYTYLKVDDLASANLIGDSREIKVVHLKNKSIGMVCFKNLQ